MEKLKDYFELLPPGTVSMKGIMGDALDKSIEARLKKVDYRHLVDPFRKQMDDDGYWRCEFWGKIVRSTIRSWRAKPNDKKLRKLIDDTVKDILSTQKPDGSISSYSPERQATCWDVWGRKYVLAGLIRYCTVIEKRPEIVKAASAVLKHLMKQVGPGGKSMPQSGWHEGMAPSSILGQVVQMYWLTGDKEFLDYANWIVYDGGCKVFEQAAEGVRSPKDICNGKAYEMTSCIEGLVELYRATGERKYLETALTYYRKVRDEEIFVTGVGGGKDRVGEIWFGGAENQAKPGFGGRGETCVTTTYIRFCLSLLRATGDATIVDELERSLYNGTLSEMTPDGSWWLHLNPTPMSAESHKVPCDDQIGRCTQGKEFFQEDCCLAQGPEALATAPMVAVMKESGKLVVNFYEPCEARLDDEISITISGDYPDGEDAAITVHCPKGKTFALKLRIPGWCGGAKVNVAGNDVPVTSGTYCEILRAWNNGDKITLHFPMPLVVMPAADGLSALRRGPIVLVRDSRLGDVNRPYGNPTKLTRRPKRKGFRRIYALDDGSLVCDFASAGNTFDDSSSLRIFC